ncbi:MAG: LCP family protein [Streptococcaceae bacterium]|jgi:LCP family protein required for cell wall assembly|nr:LCP family protein [Streptococcaceae bacterium]
MDKQRLNRLKYLRQNQDYLTRRELLELDKLEQTLRIEESLAADAARNEETRASENRLRLARQEENARIAAAEAKEAKRRAREARRAIYDEKPRPNARSRRQRNLDTSEKTSSLKTPKVYTQKKPWRWVKRIAIALAVLVVAGLAYLIYATTTAESILQKSYVDTGAPALNGSQPLSILLTGLDTGDATRGGANSWDGNTDSQILMTLNPQTQSATMVSLERDTMSNILDQNGNVLFQAKMNSAYPYVYPTAGLQGAATAAMNTVGEQAGISVNRFVVINMDGLVNLVNDVGGIDVVNDSGSTITIANTEPEYTATVPYIKGNPPQHINGEQALVFARDRDTLPNGDYGRAAHQREVLAAVFKKLLSLSTLVHFKKVLTDISGDFKTNIKSNNATLLALMSYKNCFNKMISIQYQGIGMTAAGSDGIYASYEFMPQAVDLAVQNAMRKSVGEAAISTLSSNIITYESYTGYQASDYYMPSVTVTQKGKAPVVYGLDTNGSYVVIDSSNAGDYVSVTGGAAK